MVVLIVTFESCLKKKKKKALYLQGEETIAYILTFFNLSVMSFGSFF